MNASELNRISRRLICDELVRIAAVNFACYFPYSDLEGAETKMIVYLGEMIGEVASAIEVKSVTHEKAEESLFAVCRLVPL